MGPHGTNNADGETNFISNKETVLKLGVKPKFS